MIRRFVVLVVLSAAGGCTGAHPFLYVSNVGSTTAPQPSIDIYAVGTGGGLTRSARQMLGQESANSLLVFGSTLYASSATGHVLPFGIDSMTGALNPGSPVAVGTNPQGMAVVGNTLYVANQGSNSISVFSIDASGGLTPFQTFTTTNAPMNLAADGPGGILMTSDAHGICTLAIAHDGTLSATQTPCPTTSQGSTIPADIVAVNGIFYAARLGPPVTAVRAFKVVPATGFPAQVGADIEWGSIVNPAFLINSTIATDRLFVATQGGIDIISLATSGQMSRIGTWAPLPVSDPQSPLRRRLDTRLFPSPDGATVFATNFGLNGVESFSSATGMGGDPLLGDPGEAPKAMAFFPAGPAPGYPPVMIQQIPLLRLTVSVVPAGNQARVDVFVDNSPWLQSAGDGDATPPVQIAAGAHTVRATVIPPSPGAINTVSIGHDCSPAGAITLVANDLKRCSITVTAHP